jgi:D-alanyl-D-alanine dipeptidase
MAIDIILEDAQGRLVEMGTVFDHFSADPNDNPAARAYPVPAPIAANRKMLENFMVQAGADCGCAIWPLPSEWWDFRFPEAVYNQFAPLSDADLPPQMRMCA